MLEMGVRVVKNEGLLGLYAGLSASLLRQATYSTTRFAIYETVKKQVQPADGNLAFHHKVLLAAISGLCGGIVGRRPIWSTSGCKTTSNCRPTR